MSGTLFCIGSYHTLLLCEAAMPSLQYITCEGRKWREITSGLHREDGDLLHDVFPSMFWINCTPIPGICCTLHNSWRSHWPLKVLDQWHWLISLLWFACLQLSLLDCLTFLCSMLMMRKPLTSGFDLFLCGGLLVFNVFAWLSRSPQLHACNTCMKSYSVFSPLVDPTPLSLA